MKTTKFISQYLSHPSHGKGAFPLQKAILRVLIVEDHEPMRKYIATKLRGKLQLRIVAEVAGGVDAVQKAEELRPDLIVMNVGLRGSMGSKPLAASKRFIRNPKFSS
jgi:DNA-binding NarL/FixJ family response regulator